MEYLTYVLAFILIIIFALYYYLTSTYGYWKQRGIPYLSEILPGLGNTYPLFLLRRSYAEMYMDFYNKMPGHSMVGFYNLRSPSLIVRDPELVKCVLSKNFQNFASNEFTLDEELDPLLSNNPFFIDGDRWKRTRTKITSSLTSGKLKYMYVSIDVVRNKLKDYLRSLCESNGGKVELELKNLFSKYTAEVVANATFGVEAGSFTDKNGGPFVKIANLMFEPSLVKGIFQIITLFIPNLSKILKIGFVPAEVTRFFRSLMKDIFKQREEQGIERNDFIQLMIQQKKNGTFDMGVDGELQDHLIASLAFSFFGDGNETSSITLSFVTYLLAKHPEVQTRLREEVTTAIAKHGDLTYEAIQEMTYMDQTLNESMRLYPAFGALIKTCTQEFELVGSDGITFKVPKGMGIVIPALALQRDPEYWPEPKKFDPDRFSEENKQTRHKFVHLPFGEGPRICPGIRMASLQVKAAIATVLQDFTLEVSPRTKEPIKLDPSYFLAAAVGGLWVIAKPYSK